ncbi:ATP-binding protein [Prosthecochloris sp. N3]|uniref:ATP-binding protein n=1 Tax=Prosthecochloris ethylica TaxID=2743976 RepID=A0ABR9XQL0_9CHLB|nr:MULTISPECIES: ATP-binding protein [Prosthecochloris]MEC9486771.1 ATP-binding protein [Prosthecochloris sp.]MBF0585515.1 ATP-binding protein [Prosthecochloris ethylica]MBF0636301.1 ATP-binding protein [Prosthecochloris ethylica]NUK46745.1 ATP-binding protein [Prosthecochloris ethylica]RNA64672.1 ATP-binding protein [Prosthecochloris sp. ZM_2]
MSLSWAQLESTPLLDLVGQGENVHTEFKRLVHSPWKIAKSIVAFANTEGGVILIGVDDDRRITGIHSEKEMLEVIHDAVRFHVEPAVDIETVVEEYRRRLVLLVFIPESTLKPHYHITREDKGKTPGTVTGKQVYTRVGSHNKAASRDRICLMESAERPLKISFGASEKLLLDHLEHHGSITAQEFSTLAGLPLQTALQKLVSMVRAGAIILCSKGQHSYYALP